MKEMNVITKIKQTAYLSLTILSLNTQAQCGVSYLLGSATNMFTMVDNNTTPVAINKDLNTILFVHRNNSNAFGGTSGNLRYDYSTNGGSIWTNNAGLLNPASTPNNLARYPNAVIYNPTNNINPATAYLGYLAATTNGTNWTGIVSGVRQLNGVGNTESYNQPGNQPYFIPKCIAKGANNVFWSVDYAHNGNVFTSDIKVYKGVWNSISNDINWTLNNTLVNAIDINSVGGISIAFDPTGVKGWIGYLNDYNANGWLQPTFYQTTNGGLSWSGSVTIDPNQFGCINSNILPWQQAACASQCDLTVDVNGNPHFICLVGVNVNIYGYVDQQLWHHVYDFTRESGMWVPKDLGNVLGGPITYFSPGGNALQDITPQAARTSDGTKVFFSWTDNTNYILGAANTLPNLLSKAYDVQNKMWTGTKDFSGCNINTSGKIYFMHMAKEVLMPSGSVYKIAPVYGEFTTPGDPSQPVNFRYLDNCTFSNTDFVLPSPAAPLVNIIPASPVLLCPGSSINLQTSPSFSNILWSTGGNGNALVISNPGIYSVAIESNCGVGTASVLVNVLSLSVTPQSFSICAGNTVSLYASGNAFSYNWLPGGQTSSSISVSPSSSTNYTLTANGGSCTTSTIVSITVILLPTITVNSGSICSGSSFTIIPNGASTYTISGGSATVSPLNTTSYSVTGTSSLGCVSNNTAISTITVASLPNIIIASSNTFICADETATLTASGAGSYSWSNGANANIIIVSPTLSTTYSVTGTDASGCSKTSIISQIVSPCAGIDNLSSNIQHSSFQMYPNPNNGEFTIETPIETDVAIINTLGQVVLQQHLSQGKNKIEMNGQPEGIYFVKTKSGNYKIIKE